MSTLVEFPVEAYSETAFGDFNPDTADFTIGNARALMWASQLAYENDKTIEAVRQRWGFASIVPFVQRKTGIKGSFETRGIIAERSNAAILAFGGTDPGRSLPCKCGGKFDPATPLSALGADLPAFAGGLVDDLVNGIGNVATGQIFSPAGLGTFGPLFKFLPPPIRDHLQDRYLTALGENLTPP